MILAPIAYRLFGRTLAGGRVLSTKGRIKGAAIRGFIEWYAREHDLERLKSAIRQLPQEAQVAFDFTHESLGVLPSTWFEATDVHQILDSLTQGLSPSAYDALARAAAHATVKSMMSGVQRFIFTKFMTPGAYAKFANVAFHLNYDSGTVSSEKLGPRRHAGTVHGWAAHHPFLCRMHSGIKLEIYAAMGCSGAHVVARYCSSDGDDHCGSIIAWD